MGTNLKREVTSHQSSKTNEQSQLSATITNRLKKLRSTSTVNNVQQNYAESLILNHYLKQLKPQTKLHRDVEKELKRLAPPKTTPEISYKLVGFLHLAIKEDDSELLEAVITADPDIVNHPLKEDTSKVNSLGFETNKQKNGLILAAEQNKQKLVMILINSKNFDSNSDLSHDALVAAIKNGNSIIVEQLLKAGIKPTQQDFATACAHGKLDVAKILYQSTQASFDINSALLAAIEGGDLATVMYLVHTLKANINHTEKAGLESSHDLTPLVVAIKYRHRDIANFLIKKGANNEEACKILDMTKLYISTFLNKIDEVRGELKSHDHYPLINSPDKNGYTPLMHAAHNNNEQMITSLIKAGADVNFHNENGNTALIEAVSAKSKHAVDALLQVKNIDINLRATIGKHTYSAKEIAEKNKDTTIVNAINNFQKKMAELDLKQAKLKDLDGLLTTYRSMRTDQRDEKGHTKEYLHTNFFGLFQKSYSEKTAAVQDLQNVLKGTYFNDKGKIDLNEHLATFRNGRLGDHLRKFIKNGNADSLVGRPVRTVTDFIKALQEKVTQEISADPENTLKTR